MGDMQPELATSFEILDLRSGNSIASTVDSMEAHSVLAKLADESPPDARFLALVTFDENGEAISSELANESTSAEQPA